MRYVTFSLNVTVEIANDDVDLLDEAMNAAHVIANGVETGIGGSTYPTQTDFEIVPNGVVIGDDYEEVSAYGDFIQYL